MLSLFIEEFSLRLFVSHFEKEFQSREENEEEGEGEEEKSISNDFHSTESFLSRQWDKSFDERIWKDTFLSFIIDVTRRSEVSKTSQEFSSSNFSQVEHSSIGSSFGK